MMKPRKLKCKKCGHEWYYTGEKNGTTCSKCRAWITIKEKPANAGKEKRLRRKLNIKEITERDWYNSILNLTKHCGMGKGLRKMHYRWALIKNHDGIGNSRTTRADKGEMENFFKKHDVFSAKDKEFFKNLGLDVKDLSTAKDSFDFRLERLYNATDIVNNTTYIVKNCVTSTTNLSNFLNKLVMDYGLLDRDIYRDERGKDHERYQISKNYGPVWYRWALKKSVDICPDDYMPALYHAVIELEKYILSKPAAHSEKDIIWDIIKELTEGTDRKREDLLSLIKHFAKRPSEDDDILSTW